MPSEDVTSITLRALEGEPLVHDRICEMVEATARAIAERQGVGILGLTTDDRSISVTLQASRIAAMGFAAELRRLTTSWYTRKFGVDTLWGEADARPDEVDEGDWLGDGDAWKSG